MKQLFLLLSFLSFFSLFLNTNVSAQSQTVTGTVYFMKSNSNATIVMRTVFHPQANETFNVPGIIFGSNPQNLILKGPDLTITANQTLMYMNKTNDIAYTLIAKNNLKGIFTLIDRSCGGDLFDIGLNESEIDPSILLRSFKGVTMCPPFPPEVEIIKMTGIVAKYITLDLTKISPLKQQNANIPRSEIMCKKS
jgi:hypothetical protein